MRRCAGDPIFEFFGFIGQTKCVECGDEFFPFVRLKVGAAKTQGGLLAKRFHRIWLGRLVAAGKQLQRRQRLLNAAGNWRLGFHLRRCNGRVGVVHRERHNRGVDSLADVARHRQVTRFVQQLRSNFEIFVGNGFGRGQQVSVQLRLFCPQHFIKRLFNDGRLFKQVCRQKLQGRILDFGQCSRDLCVIPFIESDFAERSPNLASLEHSADMWREVGKCCGRKLKNGNETLFVSPAAKSLHHLRRVQRIARPKANDFVV